MLRGLGWDAAPTAPGSPGELREVFADRGWAGLTFSLAAQWGWWGGEGTRTAAALIPGMLSALLPRPGRPHRSQAVCLNPRMRGMCQSLLGTERSAERQGGAPLPSQRPEGGRTVGPEGRAAPPSLAGPPAAAGYQRPHCALSAGFRSVQNLPGGWRRGAVRQAPLPKPFRLTSLGPSALEGWWRQKGLFLRPRKQSVFCPRGVLVVFREITVSFH